MAELLSELFDGAPDVPELPTETDWPKYLPKGEKLYGALVEVSDRQPFRYLTDRNGTELMTLNLRFRTIGGTLNGYHVNGSIWLPVNGTQITRRSKESMDRLRGQLYPLGLDIAKTPCPVSGEEAIQWVTGEGPWKENGPLLGKLVCLVTGKPKPAYVGKDGVERGPFTTFGQFLPVEDNIRELLKEDYQNWYQGWAEERAVVAKAASGGLDDMPF